MLDEKEQQEILDRISLSGSATIEEAKVIHIISGVMGNYGRGGLAHILNLASGQPRLQSHISKKFSLIISQPTTIEAIHPAKIRCCLCHNVISYPAWYYSIKYVKNHIHYFICFDNRSPKAPSTSCYRRS